MYRLLPIASLALMVGVSCAEAKSYPRNEKNECVFTGPNGLPSDDAEKEEEWRIYGLHKNYDLYRKGDANCDGKLTDKERRDYEASALAFVDGGLRERKIALSRGKKVNITPKGLVKPDIWAGSERDPDPCPPGARILLRDSFEDTLIYSCPKSAAEAAGATFSWSRDGELKNHVWSAKGVAGVGFSTRYEKSTSEPFVSGVAFAPAILFNRISNSSSALKPNDVNLLSFTGSGEIGIANVLNGDQYVRLRGAYNTDFDGDGRSWSVTGEWQPVSDVVGNFRLNQSMTLGENWAWRFEPLLRAHYSGSINSSLDPIFYAHDHALRIGPVLGVSLFALEPQDRDPEFWEKITLFASYQALWDVDTSRRYQLAKATAALTLDNDGHLALKASHSRGKIEETGQKIDQTLIGLSAKW